MTNDRMVRAVVIPAPGGPEVLAIAGRPLRAIGPGELLIEVAAAGLNRADLLQRRGRYPAPPGTLLPDVPGLEYAGTVVESRGITLQPGARVMGIVGGGAMATHLIVSEREAIPVPDGVELSAAAAIPEAFLTAYDALIVQAGLGPGEVCLIHAVASGVGTAAVQLAHAVSARPFGTTRTQAKLDRCKRELGLGHGMRVEGARFAAELAAQLGPADVILDLVGGAYLTENLTALALCGRLVLVSTSAGAVGELPIHLAMTKRARLLGTTLRSRPPEDKAALAQAFTRACVPLFAAGKLRPVVNAVLPMSEVAEAHQRLEQNDSFGKLVLAW